MSGNQKNQTVDSGPLHRWYNKSRRDLPFRKTREVYPIWVSEVMLQQTRVAAMLPKYQEFTARFPDLATLAAAPEEEVLAAWQGLGYYSRARNLRKGAQYILREHQGDFPSDLELALKVPGVGPYTAAAILSIALKQPAAVLDGNVKRVLDRLLGLTEKAATAVSDAEYKNKADRLMQDRGRTDPGDHNQAMMELGAMICTPGRPDCGPCPMQTQCATYASDPTGDLASRIPPKKKVAANVDLQLDAFLIYNKSRTKLLIAREDSSRFFRALWFFPYRFSGAVYFTPTASPGLRALLEGDLLGDVQIFAKGFRHSITHHRISGRVLEQCAIAGEKQILDVLRRAANATAKKQSKDAGIEWRWLPVSEIHESVVSSLARKIETIAASSADGLF